MMLSTNGYGVKARPNQPVNRTPAGVAGHGARFVGAGYPTRWAPKMSGGTLVFSSSDALPEASVLAIDRGLDQYNLSVAPLSVVKRLASFPNSETAWIRAR